MRFRGIRYLVEQLQTLPSVIHQTECDAAFSMVFQLLPISSTIFTYNCKHTEITNYSTRNTVDNAVDKVTMYR